MGIGSFFLLIFFWFFIFGLAYISARFVIIGWAAFIGSIYVLIDGWGDLLTLADKASTDVNSLALENTLFFIGLVIYVFSALISGLVLASRDRERHLESGHGFWNWVT
jgi:hypothetical protein